VILLGVIEKIERRPAGRRRPVGRLRLNLPLAQSGVSHRVDRNGVDDVSQRDRDFVLRSRQTNFAIAYCQSDISFRII
jgi:hypothetical protein